MNDDDQPTPEELAQAEALAQALDGGGAASEAGDAPLAAAALLRHARAADAPADVVDARVRAAASRALAAPPRRRRWPWLLPVGLVPAAAAIVMVLMVQRREPSAPLRGATPLPRPEAALLQAQRRAARGREDLAALDRQMRAYRQSLYAALAAREEGR